MGDFLKKLDTKTEEFCDEAVEDDHYLTGVNWQIVKDECQLELATKYNKKYKIKEVNATTKESINTAKLMMENEKVEEHEVVKDSSSQTCNTSETSNNDQNLQADYDQLVEDVRDLIRIATDESNSFADIDCGVKAWIRDKCEKFGEGRTLCES